MNQENITERALREKEQYNQGLQRGTYTRILSHARYFFDIRRKNIIDQAIRYGDGKDILEIGSQSWRRLSENSHTTPKHIVCINISEVELQKGIDDSRSSRLHPTFHLMDAHHLEFPGESFDMVFGGAILHHLDFTKALDEIERVLKPGGRIIFVEPLGINPISQLIRSLTPKARTEDEQPLGFRELAELRKRFSIHLHFEQFLSVPLGLLSYVLFRSPDNFLSRMAYRLDLALLRILPPVRFLYRSIIIVGNKRCAH